MTKIKLCGLKKPQDIECANMLRPDYVGFVFAKMSRRHVETDTARNLKNMISDGILAVGVFVDEEPENVAKLLNEDVIDLAQLHGSEDEEYIEKLKSLTSSKKKIIKAFRPITREDAKTAEYSHADMILLDAGMGTGNVFDWSIVKDIKRPYFLAGGLDCENVTRALDELSPYGVDVSSGIETDGVKDPEKMREFVGLVRGYGR